VADTQRLPAPLTDNWDWQTQAACRGMDITVFFHPPDERNAARERRAAQAKAICQACPAIVACREHALQAREPYGIWGGLSEHERAAALGVHSLRYPATIDNADSSGPRDQVDLR
jgi:WhiB family redox-sensing transcriptional regulator